MSTESEFEQVRRFFNKEDLVPDERRVTDELLDAAAQGDDAALARIKQVARERGYVPLPGDDDVLPLGPLFECPIDPSHYRAYQREVGQELICPEHDVPLRPADATE